MDYQLLAELLYPEIKETPEDIEAKYPRRELPEGAKVTRFAPSPTGFVHFGGLFPSTVGERLAHQSNGVFYLRIEDTDAKREVPGATEGLIKTLARYGVNFDEGAVLDENGNKKFKVKNSILLWNRKWEISDLDKNVLVTIKQEPRSIVKKKFYIMMVKF